MRRYVEDFFELYFPGIKGYRKRPYINLYMEINSEETGELGIIFCVHYVVINNEWEIKDDFFLLRGYKFYLFKSVTTDYDQEVKFEKGKFGFSFNPEGLSVRFRIENKGGINTNTQNTKTFYIPKSEWQPVKTLLEVISLPNVLYPQEIRQSLVGGKFPLNILACYEKSVYRTDDQRIFIHSTDVAEVLRKSESVGKEEAFAFISNLNDYIPFNPECCMLS